jgi:PAS domain S-box-containing protein
MADAGAALLFTAVPLFVVLASTVASTAVIRKTGELPLLSLVGVLVLMGYHQTLEGLRFVTDGVAVGVTGELVETGANLLAAGAVYYAVDFGRRQQQLREAATASQQRCRTLTQESPLPILVVRDGEILFANRAATGMFAFDDEEIAGRSVVELIHPQDREPFEDQLETMLANEGRVVSTEQRWQRLDGAERRVVISGGCAAHEGGTAAFLVLQDRTEVRSVEADLRQSQERFETLFEHASDAIFLIDPETMTITEANRRAADLLEYPQSELVGTSAHDIHPHEVSRFGYERQRLREQPASELHPDTYDQYQEFTTTVLEEGTGWIDSITCQAADGQQVPAEVSGAVCELDGTTHIIALLRDVSERRERERLLRRENERLDNFAKIVSHDLRNPLDVIGSRLALLKNGHSSEHIDHLEQALERAQTIVEDTLVLAQRGQHVETTQSVELRSAVASSWQTVATESASLDLEADATIQADPDRLRHLLENLLGNAVKHGVENDTEHTSAPQSAGGSLDITVTVGTLPDGFYVADNGAGFGGADSERLFEPGFSTARSGTGFGLTIVERMAESHGWQVTATESECGGARFEVSGVEIT